MIIYSESKSGFLSDVKDDVYTLADRLKDNVKSKMGRTTTEEEYRSWQNSLSRMEHVLDDPEIPDNVGIAIEYNVPPTSKRIDFMISGYDKDHNPNVVIIELKQWEKIEPVEGMEELVETYTGRRQQRVAHPSYQVWSYKRMLQDYNTEVQNRPVCLESCCYLHNYTMHENDPIKQPQYTFVEDSPIFAKGERDKLQKFIKSVIKYGDRYQVISDIDKAEIRPSKSLQNELASMITGNQEFIMIDEQKVAYETILKASRDCQKDGKKRTIIVEGGPGTGKSVIAVNLLVELTREGQYATYVSKNEQPRKVYSQKLAGVKNKKEIGILFQGPGKFIDAPENSVATIIADEAHRLNERSGVFHNQGENQIKELIHAALCSVFFIDNHQRVTLSDIGSTAEIEKWAKEAGSEIIKLELASQFRCNGSDGYLAWIDNVLEIRDTANFAMDTNDYDVRIIDDPNELRKLIVEKNNENHCSRMLAGYCWDWNNKRKNDTNYHDIVIGDFEMSWNLGNSVFAIDDTSIDQVGCIHTSQGLEFDYVGVIIGDDMRYYNGHIVTDYTKRAKTDQALRGIKKIASTNLEEATQIADEIIKNTYRTLLTRGMKGCYIYCTDDNLAQYLKSRIKGH